MANRKSLLRRLIQVQDPDTLAWVKVGNIEADGWSGGDLKGGDDGAPRGDGTVMGLGGDKVRDDATSTHQFDASLWLVMPTLQKAVGSINNVRIQCTPLDDRRLPLAGGRTYTLTGDLKGMSDPEGKAGDNSGSELELTYRLDALAIYQ